MLKRLQPSGELAAIIDDEPVSPAQVVEGFWGYIRENGLQDARNPRWIKADENLGRIFGGMEQVTLFELTRMVNKHLFVCSKGEAVTDEELGREFEEKVLAGSYETLGCSPEISDEELKRKFRELCQEYHPDRLAGEVPAGIVKLAREKFQEIQSAYAPLGDIPELMRNREGEIALSSFLQRHFPDLLKGGVKIRIHDTL